MDLNRASRYLSYLLRHHPEAAGITLDAHGWADVDQLLAGMKKHRITRAQLEEIVAADQKQRYAFDERRTKIRANQGHSIAVDVELREGEPPARLWHGSAKRFAASIAAQFAADEPPVCPSVDGCADRAQGRCATWRTHRL